MWKKGYVDARYNEWKKDVWERELASHNHDDAELLERAARGNATIGYVAKDSCPGIGYDTVHTTIPFFSAPGFIASPSPSVADDTPIDLVFVVLIESDILAIVGGLWNKTVTSANVQTYSPISADETLGVFAQNAWN